MHSDGRYRPIKLTPDQGEYIKQVFAVNGNGSPIHSLNLNIQARRHGKTIIHCLIDLYFFTSRDNFTIQLVGNSEHHSRRVQWKLICDIIRHTPELRKMIPEKYISNYQIHIPHKGNAILAMRGVSVRSAFGDKLSLIHVSDLHAATDLSYYNALQAATLDVEGSIILIDTNVDGIDGPVHQLQLAAKDDQSIHAHHRYYKDIQDFEEHAPSWINRAKARRLMATLLPAEAKRDILGQRGDAQNQLFTSDIIELCKSPYKAPVHDIQALTQGRAYKIGAGLDRSKSIFGSATGADNTIFTVILKVASESGEPEIYLLEQVNVFPNTAGNVKRIILNAHERYNLTNLVLENYEVADLAPWLDDQKIPFELVSAHESAQTISFTEFFRIAKEGRFHFPSHLKKLESEMRTFTYTLKANNKYSFGHSTQKFKDDRVYSVNWAIFSLRSQILQLFTIGNIRCNNKSSHRQHCYLMNGNFILPGCSQECVAHLEVREMYQQFTQFQTETEMDLQSFFRSKVKRTGAKIYQAA